MLKSVLQCLFNQSQRIKLPQIRICTLGRCIGINGEIRYRVQQIGSRFS